MNGHTCWMKHVGWKRTNALISIQHSSNISSNMLDEMLDRFKSALNLLVNLLIWTGNVLMNELLIIRTVANMVLQNHLVPWIFWWCPYIFMNYFCNNNFDNFFKSYIRCNNFSTNKFLTSNSDAIFNIPDKNALSSSIHFSQFSYSFYEYSFFNTSIFYNILM